MELLESVNVMGSGAIFIAVIIAATEVFHWPRKLHYLWALIILAWGIIAL